jgi:hypothetical protein
MTIIELLGMYMNPEELRYHLLLDRIICSGQWYLEILQMIWLPRQDSEFRP